MISDNANYNVSDDTSGNRMDDTTENRRNNTGDDDITDDKVMIKMIVQVTA
jgi:hypothetical protein